MLIVVLLLCRRWRVASHFELKGNRGCDWLLRPPFYFLAQSLLAEWRVILTDIGVPFRQELSLRQYLSTAKQRLEWQVRQSKV